MHFNGAVAKINNTQHGFSAESVKIFVESDIEKEIKNVLESLDMVQYEKIQIDKYAGYISNYNGDDIDMKLDRMIVDIVKILADSYQMAYQNKQTTSVSNFFKTDAKYYDDIVTKFGDSLSLLIGDDLKSTIDIFKRD